jgi:hypothetical protein
MSTFNIDQNIIHLRNALLNNKTQATRLDLKEAQKTMCLLFKLDSCKHNLNQERFDIGDFHDLIATRKYEYLGQVLTIFENVNFLSKCQEVFYEQYCGIINTISNLKITYQKTFNYFKILYFLKELFHLDWKISTSTE